MHRNWKNLLKALPLAFLVIAAFEAEAQTACEGFRPSTVTIDKQKAQRYVISKGDLLRCLPAQPAAPWKVTKEAWSDQDEANFKNFVRSIGKGLEAGLCNTMDTCLASSANPYRGQLEAQATFFADCADFPMYLRAYFAYKNGLPMSFGTGLEANPATSEQISANADSIATAQAKLDQAISQKLSQNEIIKRQETLDMYLKQKENILNSPDTRYTRNGNHFNSRLNIPNSAGAARDFFRIAQTINDGVSSGSYRMLLTAPGQVLPDFYAPAITRDAIQIGTVTYKPTGHVAIVYDISKNGDVMLMDAHPDNSLSRVAYSRDFERSIPTHGAGFKNWRPLRVENAKRDAQGVIVQGNIVFARDEEITHFSMEQYFGNADVNNSESGKSKWVVNNSSVDWYDFVKIRLASGKYQLDPVFEFQADMNNLCGQLQGRAQDVETALQAKISAMGHPANLPENIYGAEGDWEAYSTPGRDLRIRKVAKDVIENAKRYVTKLQAKDPYMIYKGTNLKKDLLKIYNQVNSSCMITYNNSQMKPVRLGLGTALKRLTKMSFDPYLCVERRWGATSKAENISCADDTEKAEWYKFQQFLRNLTDKDTNAIMGWSLPQLKDMAQRGSVDNGDHSAEYDILKKLSEL